MATMHVEVDALAGAIFQDVTKVVAEGLVLADSWAEEDDAPELTQSQRVTLVNATLLSVAGLEETIKRTLADGLERWTVESSDERGD